VAGCPGYRPLDAADDTCLEDAQDQRLGKRMIVGNILIWHSGSRR
jgi:hypothetical protein